MTRGILLGLALAASILSIPAIAHHSFDGSFDRNKQVALSGTVTEFSFSEPHVFFRLAVTGADGKPQSWIVETTSAFNLANRGWTAQSIKVGETLKVDGWPARQGKTYMRLHGMTHADGSAVSLWLPQGDVPLPAN